MPPHNFQQRSTKAFQLPLTILLFFLLFNCIIYVAIDEEQSSSTLPKIGPHGYREVATEAKHRLGKTVTKKREQLRKALDTISTSGLPKRLRDLRDSQEIVGERIGEIREGSETVHEILHASTTKHKMREALNEAYTEDTTPIALSEVTDYLTNWIHELHETLWSLHKPTTYEMMWKAYHDLTVKTLYVWDRKYLARMPSRRGDGSIFLSIATYRDENCFNTISQAYQKAKNPEKLFVGLVQQNCHANCRSGVLEGGKMEDVPPDADCHQQFCDSPEGKDRCDQVRVLNIDEPESLGPYAARYFASKLWYGEDWFMQTDAHMTFKQDWDLISVQMLKAAPSKKPVLSHYPPSHTVDLEAMTKGTSHRINHVQYSNY